MFIPRGRAAALPLALSLIASSLLGTAAFAGGCPAGNVVEKDGQKPGATAHKGVEQKTLGSIDLSKEKVNIAGRMLRVRRLVIQPGGEVAWHSHEDRPALIYVTEGAITEYSSHCSVPIEHKAGDLSVESAGLSHWWKNNTTKPVTLLSSDLAATPDEHNM
jgi:quercetin dioxygenase-like cupin family protein